MLDNHIVKATWWKFSFREKSVITLIYITNIHQDDYRQSDLIWIGVLFRFQEVGCKPDSTFDEDTSIKHFSRLFSAFFGRIFLKIDTWLPDCSLSPEYPPGEEDREFGKVKLEPFVNFTALMRETIKESERRTFRQLLLPRNRRKSGIETFYFTFLFFPWNSPLLPWVALTSYGSSMLLFLFLFLLKWNVKKTYFEPISLRNVWTLGMGLYWKNSKLRAWQSYCQGNVMKILLSRKVSNHPDLYY